MLRGSFQPHALASSGSVAAVRLQGVGEVVDHLGAHVLGQALELPARHEPVDPAVRVAAQVERVLVVVEVRADVHAAGADDAADDARARAARGADHPRVEPGEGVERRGERRDGSGRFGHGDRASALDLVTSPGERRPGAAESPAIIRRMSTSPPVEVARRARLRTVLRDRAGTAAAFASSARPPSSPPFGRRGSASQGDQIAVDPDFFEAALRARPEDRPAARRRARAQTETAEAMLVARIEQLELGGPRGLPDALRAAGAPR